MPKDEAEDVAREIEGHTGLIVQGGGGFYEFSHLSLQEFLCANFLVRDPFSRNFKKYLEQYPSPVAIAVSLSANPNEYFAQIILNNSFFKYLERGQIEPFLHRLISEIPRFTISYNLGYAILKLIFLHRTELIYSLFDFFGVLESLALCLENYFIDFDQSSDSYYFLQKTSKAIASRNLYLPQKGKIGMDIFELLTSKKYVSIVSAGQELSNIGTICIVDDKIKADIFDSYSF